MALWFLFALAPLQAAEFGEANVATYIGQPLVAEVELTALSPEEQGALQVRPAPLDVYRGANIQFNPVLASLHWVVQHRGQRQFIRITTDRPVRAPYLNLFFELGVKNNTSVRALTLWLESAPLAAAGAEEGVDSGANAHGDADAHADAGPHARANTDAMAANDAAMPPADSSAVVLPAAGHAHSCSGQARCAAAERENRIISRHISELEKNVGDLRKVIVGGAGTLPRTARPAVPAAASVPPEVPAAQASEEASADTPLFLDKEAPIVPKKPVQKPTPWKWYAAGGAALLALAMGAWLAFKKTRRAQKPTSSKPVPVRKPSAFAAWRTQWLAKWGKRKSGAKDSAVQKADAGVTPEEDLPHEAGAEAGAEATPPKAGKKGGAGGVARLRQRIREITQGLLQRISKRGKKAPAADPAPPAEA